MIRVHGGRLGANVSVFASSFNYLFRVSLLLISLFDQTSTAPQLAKGNSSSFTFRLDVFDTRRSSNPVIKYPHEIILGSDLFLQLRIVPTSSNVEDTADPRAFPVDCFLSKTSHPSTTASSRERYILRSGCPVDKSTVIIHTQNDDDLLAIVVSRPLFDVGSFVFLHCRVAACAPRNAVSEEFPECPSSTACIGIRRSAVASSEWPETGHVYAGPFRTVAASISNSGGACPPCPTVETNCEREPLAETRQYVRAQDIVIIVVSFLLGVGLAGCFCFVRDRTKLSRLPMSDAYQRSFSGTPFTPVSSATPASKTWFPRVISRRNSGASAVPLKQSDTSLTRSEVTM